MPRTWQADPVLTGAWALRREQAPRPARLEGARYHTQSRTEHRARSIAVSIVAGAQIGDVRIPGVHDPQSYLLRELNGSSALATHGELGGCEHPKKAPTDIVTIRNSRNEFVSPHQSN